MKNRANRWLQMAGVIVLAAGAVTEAAAQAVPPEGKFSQAVAFDRTVSLRDLAQRSAARGEGTASPGNTRSAASPAADAGFSGDGAVDSPSEAIGVGAIPPTTANFEGLSNQDNFNIFGIRVNPPDPVGDVGPNHYVEMVNVVFAVYDKAGNRLLGPVDIGTLWLDFPVEDCTDASGDPIVVYDQTEDRWILSQFTTRGLNPATPTAPFYNCIAISQTGDPTGAYYRYAFITQPDVTPAGNVLGYFFPDYPKYGVWSNAYILTTRDFGVVNKYGISVYALEKDKMVDGDPTARAVQFFLDSTVYGLNLVGDGLLPPDLDGHRRPNPNDPAPIVGTQDDNFYGATFAQDALNIWELTVQWRTPRASLILAAQLPVAPFDSIFPCGVVPSTTAGVFPTPRDCLPQPGVTDGSRYLDVLSYRQRPTWRLAYRNFGGYDSLVTNQTVEAAPGVAGIRWYEIRRRPGKRHDSVYSIHQQGTWAPGDGVHRWMGSIAQDRNGNIALGYNVVNGVDVYPGIRYTGRLAGDSPGQMTLGEGTIVDGSGVQTSTGSRWGDYSSMNVDPVDDCTFWYVNEYYTGEGQLSSPGGWQTRIASFQLPGCTAP